MEDENTKEENQPSTSKKESQRTNSGNDLYDDRHDDRASNSDSSLSATYSVRSRIDMTDARPEVPKPTIKTKPPERKKRAVSKGSKVVQMGSRSQMLSPLFVKTNAALQEHTCKSKRNYCEISPEMIYEGLRNLSLWKQEVPTGLLYEFIRVHYPVNRDENELYIELMEKLRIACIVGMVSQITEDFWCLTSELQQQHLTANHVTLFWQAYADTLNPIYNRKEPVIKENSEQETNTRIKSGTNGDDLI
uniref:Uncharacterized protein n=1 Tax=Heliothis virescens TaxID=7102 RepID=A0A2A4JLD1_HELVI